MVVTNLYLGQVTGSPNNSLITGFIYSETILSIRNIRSNKALVVIVISLVLCEAIMDFIMSVVSQRIQSAAPPPSKIHNEKGRARNRG